MTQPDNQISSAALVRESLLAPLQFVLVDMDAETHNCMRTAIQTRATLWRAHAFFDPRDALQHLQQAPADVALLDTELPNIPTLDYARMLRAILPHLALIFLATSADHRTVLWYHLLPAQGYLLKPLNEDRLVEAMARAARGVHTVCEEAARLLVESILPQAVLASRKLLTQREGQVMDYVARGWRDKEIAGALGISPTTVHAHRTKAYRRLGAHGHQEAVNKYLQLPP